MKATINRQMLEQISFDSGSPTGSATVVHRFDQPGLYAVRLMREEATLAVVPLSVSADTPLGLPQEQVSLDVARILARRESDAKRDPLFLRPGGHIAFTASSRTGPFRISVDSQERERKGPAFDSRRLERDDIFAVTLLRPGAYTVTNDIDKSRARMVMAYPVVGERPYSPPPPVSIEVYNGFKPEQIQLQPAQGAIFRIGSPARIRIELSEPDDGPKDRPKPSIGLSREATLAAIERLRQLRKNKDQDKKSR